MAAGCTDETYDVTVGLENSANGRQPQRRTP